MESKRGKQLEKNFRLTYNRAVRYATAAMKFDDAGEQLLAALAEWGKIGSEIVDRIDTISLLLERKRTEDRAARPPDDSVVVAAKEALKDARKKASEAKKAAIEAEAARARKGK